MVFSRISLNWQQAIPTPFLRFSASFPTIHNQELSSKFFRPLQTRLTKSKSSAKMVHPGKATFTENQQACIMYLPQGHKQVPKHIIFLMKDKCHRPKIPILRSIHPTPPPYIIILPTMPLYCTSKLKECFFKKLISASPLN